MSTTKDQASKDMAACLQDWDYAAFDQILGNHGTHQVSELLFGFIEDGHTDLADAAAFKLRGLCLSAELGTIGFIRLLGHSDERVRTRATSSLYTIDGTNAWCFLWCLHNMLTGGVDLYTTSAYAVRKTFHDMPWGTSPDGLRSALSIEAIPPGELDNHEDFDAALGTWSRLNEPYRRILKSPGSAKGLLADLESLDTAERAARVAAAGWGTDGAMEALTKSSYSECLRTKLLSIINLSQFSTQFDRAALGAIVSHLRSENAVVRRAASRVLLETAKDAAGAIDAMIDALQDSDEDVRCNVIQAVGEIGPTANRAVPRLIDILNDNADGCRVAAVVALGRIGNSSLPAVMPLLHLLRRRRPGIPPDLGMRGAFGGILYRYPSNSNGMKKIVIGLGEALSDPDPAVRSVVAYALSLVGKYAAPVLPQIVLGLSDDCDEVRFWLGSLFEEIASPPRAEGTGS